LSDLVSFSHMWTAPVGKLFFDVLSDLVSFSHMWTAPVGKLFFDVLSDLVSFSHMCDLFVRPWPLVLMKFDCLGPNHCNGFDS
jgi:hypothetical protein